MGGEDCCEGKKGVEDKIGRMNKMRAWWQGMG